MTCFEISSFVVASLPLSSSTTGTYSDEDADDAQERQGCRLASIPEYLQSGREELLGSSRGARVLPNYRKKHHLSMSFVPSCRPSLRCLTESSALCLHRGVLLVPCVENAKKISGVLYQDSLSSEKEEGTGSVTSPRLLPSLLAHRLGSNCPCLDLR
jgi:hypothetical protein